MASERSITLNGDCPIARPTKLPSGDWGARVEGAVEPGDEIVIITRAGKTWPGRVEHVVSTDGDATIVSTVAARLAVLHYEGMLTESEVVCLLAHHAAHRGRPEGRRADNSGTF